MYFDAFNQDMNQISFYLQPHIGIELPFSSFSNKNFLPKFIENSATDAAIAYGFSLVADFNKKFSIEFGYTWGNIGWGLNYFSKTDSAKFEFSGRTVSDPTLKRLLIKFHQPLLNVKIPKSEIKTKQYADIKRYWAVFDVNLMVGISIEYLAPTNYDVDIGFSGTFNGNRDIVELEETVQVLNENGYGIQAGIILQFYNNNKRRLQLGFIYHQGIEQRIKVTVSPTINNVELHDFDMYSRGSMFAFYAAYPLLLFEKKQE